MGRLDDAIQFLEKAVSLDSNAYQSLDKLGTMYLFKLEYDKASVCFRRLAADEDAHVRSLGRGELASVAFHKGQFREAIRTLDDGVAADRLDGAGPFWTMFGLLAKASALGELGQYNAAVDAIRESSQLKQLFEGGTAPKNNWLWLEAPMLARAGRFREADSVIAAWGYEPLREDTIRFRRYCFGMSGIAAAHGDWVKAVAYADTSVNMPGRLDWIFSFMMQYAQVLVDAGQYGEAVTMLERARKIYLRPPQAPEWDAKYHYLLARAYEASNWRKQAKEQYETFLSMWKDADPDLSAIVDARQRLAELK
jgi:tetratricopeptide (TPR) repeat protein